MLSILPRLCIYFFLLTDEFNLGVQMSNSLLVFGDYWILMIFLYVIPQNSTLVFSVSPDAQKFSSEGR